MYLLISVLFAFAVRPSGWEIFEDTRFKWQYDKNLGLEVEIPVFNREIRALEGREVTLTGHYLPLDLKGNSIIISKFPYASCFFCGAAPTQNG